MKRYIKFTVDFFMILLIPCLFAVKNNIWHEILGLAFLTLITIHIILNFKKLKILIKNKFNFIFNIVIAVCILLVAAAGILNSQYLFNFIKTSNQHFFKTIHMFVAIIVFILAAVHTGINIKNIKESKGDDVKTSKAKTIVASSILILIVLYGLYACYAQQIWNNFIQPFNYSQAGSEINFDNNQNRPSMPGSAGQDNNTNNGGGDSDGSDNSSTNNSDNQNVINDNQTDNNSGPPSGDNKIPPNDNGGVKPDGKTMPEKQPLNSLWYKTLIDYMSIFVLFSSAAYFIAKLAFKPKNNNDNDEKVEIS